MTAKRFYAAAFDLWADEPGRPELLFRYGRALRSTEGTGDEVLAEARDGLLAAGDRETAAEAEAIRARLSWDRGLTAEALERIERASGLIEEAPPSGAKAHVLSERARIMHFNGKSREAIAIGREALEMAEALGEVEQQAELLNTIGIARAMIDDSDRGAIDDLERSIAFARRAGAFNALSRALFNTVQVRMLTVGLGDAHGEAQALWDEGTEVCERFRIETEARWFRGGYTGYLGLAGRWDDALREAERFIAEVEGGSAHYLVAECRMTRGAIRLARGDVAGALDDARKSVDFARTARDVQVLHPTFGFSARVHALAGERAHAEALVDEVLASAPVIGMYATDLAWATRELDRGDEFVERAFAPQSDEREPSPWRVAACAVAAGDVERAADLYEEIGTLPNWAYARLVGAEASGSGGAELERALEFFREVGATAYLERGEALLAKSA